jgi:hypothetical protein
VCGHRRSPKRSADDPDRSFCLYLDARWEPTWPAELIDWPDFGVPVDAESAAAQIEAAFAKARSGELVEVGCLGGSGRTATVLACMAVLAGVPSAEAVNWVRRRYRPQAVETPEQEAWVEWVRRTHRPQAADARALVAAGATGGAVAVRAAPRTPASQAAARACAPAS